MKTAGEETALQIEKLRNCSREVMGEGQYIGFGERIIQGIRAIGNKNHLF